MARQYIACKFRPTDKRDYTYHYDGDEPIAVGDRVEIGDRSGEGVQVVHVFELGRDKPPFPTKPINGLAPPKVD